MGKEVLEMFRDAVIVSTARTAIGSFGGTLKDMSAIDLGTIAVKKAIERAGIDAKEVEELVLGCVGQYGLNAFLARVVGLNSGCAVESSGQTINRLCSSGLQSIITAATIVDHGDADVVVAGGAESMSNYPFSLSGARWGLRMGDSQLKDDLITALSEPFTGTHIAITAQNIASKYNLTRVELDAYALDSQEKARRAIAEGKFKDEIVPIDIKTKKEIKIFDTDEHPRETSIDKLGKLKPIFKADGVITAGNASGVNDGAAALVIMSSKKAKELGCTAKARIIDYSVSGVDPNYMGMGPVSSTKKLLHKTGIRLEEIGLVELNEAFAAQALACIKELELNPDIVNVNGSGISLGHPIGATGAIISVKLINEMARRNVKYGLATLCIGGGQGMSVLFENL
jgi:acetyl-CoA C-acetyltransferase